MQTQKLSNQEPDNNMKSQGMKATFLEKILVLMVIVIFFATIAAYYFLSNFAKSQAVEADHSMISAQSTQKDIENMEKAHKWLVENPDIVTKTNSIVADASQYKYQDQVINDIESYANQSKVNVTDYKFNEAGGSTTGATGSGASSGAGATSSQAPAAATGTPTTPGASSTSTPQLPSDLTATTVTLAFNYGKSVPYSSIMLFIKKIEKNVTRMQITNLSMTPDPQSRGKVNVTMTISLFINKGA